MKNVSKEYIISSGLAIFACFLWSTAFAGVKIGLEYFAPLAFASTRFILAGFILLPFGLRGFKPGILWKNKYSILKISIFQTFLLYTLFYLGINLVSGAMAAIIVGASPVFSAVTAHIAMHNDKLSKRRILSLIFGIGGVSVIAFTRNPYITAGLLELTGIFALMCSSFASALGNVIVAKNKSNINPLLLTSCQMILGGLFIALLSLIMEGLPDFNQGSIFYLTLTWLSLLSATAFSIWFTILKKGTLKVSEINMWKFIIPVNGAVLSWIILPGEAPDLISISGMILVAIAIIMI